jgi:4-amino-4-deoxy-L-arabinose transferase-like glycosyltransferase
MDAPPDHSTLAIGRWRARFVVLAAGLPLLIPGLGDRRVLTYHEVCFAQPAREMLSSGRWLTPEIAGVVFPDKPPLGHWAAAAGMALLGENEFAVRLPFATAGILLGCLVAELGIAVWGAWVGMIAGLVQLTCYYTLLEARLAECDILLTLAVAGGLAAFAVVEVVGQPFHWLKAVALHGCAGAAFLAKGPIGLVFIGSPVLAFLAVEGRWKNLLRWFHPVGLFVSLAAVVGWPLAVVWSHPEIVEGWKRHNLDRFSGSLGGDATWPVYYLAMIPLLLLPWTPWVVRGWWEARQSDRPEVASLRRFTLCWILPGLLVISAASWRHKHYAVPLLPPLSLWGAVGLTAWMRSFPVVRSTVAIPANQSTWLRMRRGRAAPFIWATCSSGIGIGAAWAGVKNADVFFPLAVIVSFSAAAIASFKRRRRPRWALAALFVGVGGTASWTLLHVMPRFDSYAVQTTFARRIASRIGDEPLFVPHIPTEPGVPLALPENQIAFYLPLNLHVLTDATSTTNEWILAPERFHQELPGYVAVDRCDRLRGSMKPSDRLTLFRRVDQVADESMEVERARR